MTTGGLPEKILRWAGQVLYAFAAVFLTCFASWASGLTVPSGSTFNVKDNQINVAGDVLLAGTLTTTTGTIALDGDWTTSGAGMYSAGMGNVHFNAAAGLQVITPGTTVGDGFFNLIHDGAGTVRLSSSQVNIYGDFTNSTGTFDANGIDMALYGNWDNLSAFTHNNNSVFLVGADQGIYGTNTFYNLTKQLATATSRTLPSVPLTHFPVLLLPVLNQPPHIIQQARQAR